MERNAFDEWNSEEAQRTAGGKGSVDAVDTVSVEQENQDYYQFNAMINLLNEEGKLQIEQDKIALKKYFNNEINPKMVRKDSLREKLDYLFDNGYYEREVFEVYDFEFLKKLYKRAYAYNFRFNTFMGAYKFYRMYALISYDKTQYLESYEDRVVANALFLGAGNETLALNVVDEMMTRRYQPATPTFLNAGKAQRGGFTSCFLLSVSDNLESIDRAETDAKQLSKRGGGVAIRLTDVRENGAPIKGYVNSARGVVPVMKMLEDAFKYADQLGQRQGAGAVYLSAHHPDILQFLDTKKENADEATRIKTLSIGVVLSDVTYELAKRGGKMALFSPYDVERVYGVPMSQVSITEKYDEMVADERITKTYINARDLFTQIAAMQFESGYPYILNEDNANRAHNNAGKITHSNLCVTGDTELLTDKGYVRAEDLFTSQDKFNVVVDERARAMDLSSTGTSVQKSTQMFKTAEYTEVLKLETLEGFELKATPWHKMYVERDGELVKIPLVEVETGDKILVQGARSAAFGSVHKPNEAYLAGIIATNDAFSEQRSGADNTVYIDVNGDKREFKNAILSAVRNVLAGREDLAGKNNDTLEPEFMESSYADKEYLSSAPLAQVLLELGVDKDTNNVVPDFVKQGDEETVRSYLCGVFQMDSAMTGNDKLGTLSIELGSAEKVFLRGIQKLLLTFGAYTRIHDGVSEGSDSLQSTYVLKATNRTDREIVYGLVTWSSKQVDYWESKCAQLSDTIDAADNAHNFRATVTSIETAGYEDVYDVTVDNGHSVIFNGIATGNCSEILQSSTDSTFQTDNYFDEVGEDISCNLGSLNVDNAFNSDDFSSTIDTAVRSLTTVTDTLHIDVACSPTIVKGNEATHAIGLGQMNLHGFFARNHIHYDSEEAIDFTRMYFYSVLYEVLRSSNAIARERGETYKRFKESKYYSGEFFDKYTDRELPDFETDKVRALFASSTVHVPTREDWVQLKSDVHEYGLYHAYMQAVAPTGSISYVNESTSSIHPIVAPIETRKDGKNGRTYVPMPYLSEDTIPYYKTAYEIDNRAIIDIYATAQEFVDQGMSLTLFYTNENSTRDVVKNYIYGWTHGIKTMYYARVKTANLSGTEVETANGYCESCQL